MRPIERARTLPVRLYVDTAVLEAEKKRIFGRTWRLVLPLGRSAR